MACIDCHHKQPCDRVLNAPAPCVPCPTSKSVRLGHTHAQGRGVAVRHPKLQHCQPQAPAMAVNPQLIMSAHDEGGGRTVLSCWASRVDVTGAAGCCCWQLTAYLRVRVVCELLQIEHVAEHAGSQLQLGAVHRNRPVLCDKGHIALRPSSRRSWIRTHTVNYADS